MCLLTFIYSQGNRDLVLCSNRDEDLARPTLRGRLHALGEQPSETGEEHAAAAVAYYPQDREAGGTWIALSNVNARFAVVLNFHDWRYPRGEGQDGGATGGAVLSRGLVALNFINAPADVTAEQFAHQVLAGRYGSYSLLVGDALVGCYYVSNRDADSPVFMPPGVVHAISNGRRSDLWPKMTISVSHVREALKVHDWDLESASAPGSSCTALRSLESARSLTQSLLRAFRDDTPHPDATSGTESDIYMRLAAIFVKPTYLPEHKVTLRSVNFGTRTTTIAVSLPSPPRAPTEEGGSYTDLLITEADRDEASGEWSDQETVLARFTRIS